MTNQLKATGLRASYRGVGPYRGVVKDEAGAVVAECEHWHPNRDHGRSPARDCAMRLLQDLSPEDYEAALPAWMRP